MVGNRDDNDDDQKWGESAVSRDLDFGSDDHTKADWNWDWGLHQ